MSEQIFEKTQMFFNHHCANCGSTNNLHIHHLTPKYEGGSDNFDNLTLLCRDCHIKIHQGKSIRFKKLRILIGHLEDGTPLYTCDGEPRICKRSHLGWLVGVNLGKKEVIYSICVGSNPCTEEYEAQEKQ